jgi:hypothetical protein
VYQSGIYNDSYVSQLNGNDNKANVNQSGTYGESNVLQNGNSNFADISQSGEGDISWVIQNGDNKSATVEQSGVGVPGAEFNESFIIQSGAGAHTAYVNQAHAPAGGWNNISTITQTGTVNASASVMQTGSGNRASTIQY